jgi:hypothetical protein
MGSKGDSNFMSALQCHANYLSHSPHITSALAVTAPKESVGAMDGLSAALIRSLLVIPDSDDSGPQEVVEVPNDKQDWEIRDIIGKEVVNCEVHYLVEWSATLMPKYKLGKARDLVARFEARLCIVTLISVSLSLKADRTFESGFLLMLLLRRLYFAKTVQIGNTTMNNYQPIVEELWSPCLQTLEGLTDSVYSVSFSPDGHWLTSASDNNTVCIWDAQTGAVQQTLEGYLATN